MASLRLGLLGSLQITVAGDLVTGFESDKARALLAYLAVESNQPHRREALIGLLWPESPEETARRNLRQTLFNLRHAIGDHTAVPPYLLITREEIQFNTASDYTLDVAELNASLDTCVRQLPKCLEDCAIRAARLQRAMELYRGEFLQEFFLDDSAPFEEWALKQRVALHQRALNALAYLARYYELQADYERARRYALCALGLEPWREEAHRQVMRSLAVSGQRSAALVQYETCRRILADELGVEPSVETRALYEQLSRGEFSSKHEETRAGPPSRQPPLPVQLTPFVGRERELAELSRLLAQDKCRLITLVGLGGIGKSRLALELASAHRDTFRHGVVFVPLASVDSTAAIVPAIAQALGLTFYGPGDPKTQLLNYLHERCMLLVLDNVEQLAHGALLFMEILQQAPEIKLLVTSREQLNLQEEWVFEVEGLSIPTGAEDEGFQDSSAATLFLQRARRANAGFVLPPAERPEVIRTCRLVGGMPLALELAATWVRTLSCREIAQEIERSLYFLAAAIRDLPERHSSLRAVFDYSWRMLTPAERQLLRELSVFRGGFQRSAAEQVSGATLSLLSALVSKSLLRRTAGRSYELHELVRQYAAMQLHQNPAEEFAVRDRHSQHYLSYMRERETALHSGGQVEALAELTAELDNLRAAWEWAAANGQVTWLRDTVWPLWYYYELRSLFQEGESMLLRAVESAQKLETAHLSETVELEQVIAYLQVFPTYFTFRLGRIAEAQQRLEQSLQVLRRSDDRVALLDALWALGTVCMFAGQFQEASLHLREAYALASASARPWETTTCAILIGRVEYELGHSEESRGWLDEGWKLSQAQGDPVIISFAISSLTQTLHALGKCAKMEPILRQGVEQVSKTGQRFELGLLQEQLARFAYAAGDMSEASHLCESTIALYRELGDVWSLSRVITLLGNLYLGRDEVRRARCCFTEALQIAVEADLCPNALGALVGLDTVLAREGAHASAFEVATYILQHPAAGNETRTRAAQLCAELESQITRNEIDSAQARTRDKSLDEIVRDVLRKVS